MRRSNVDQGYFRASQMPPLNTRPLAQCKPPARQSHLQMEDGAMFFFVMRYRADAGILDRVCPACGCACEWDDNLRQKSVTIKWWPNKRFPTQHKQRVTSDVQRRLD